MITMVLKGVNWVHIIIKLGYNGLERSQWGSHNDKFRSNGLESESTGYHNNKI